ncbi:MAG: Hsp70 family protein, partial [Promethearchaeota archaeon]
ITISAFNRKTGKVINGEVLINKEYMRYFEVNEYGIKIDSVILIHPEKDILYGSKHAPDIFNESHVVWGMKRKIRNNVFDNYNVLGRGLNLLEITKNLFNFIFKSINWDKFNLIDIGFAYPVDSSPEYRVWLKEILLETFDIKETKINFLDEATSNCLGLVYLKNFEISLDKYYLIIDIGGGTTDCAVLQFKSLDGKKVDIFSRKSESIGGSSIEKQLFFEKKRKSNLEFEANQKDKLVYLIGKKKIEILKEELESETIILDRIKIILEKEELNDIIWKRKLIKKIIGVIDETIDESFQYGVDRIDNVILTGGGSETPIFKKEIMKFCKNKIEIAKITHLRDEFSISLGLRALFLDFTIQARLLDEFGILEFNEIDSQFIDFTILIKKFTKFPTPFYKYELFSHNNNQTGRILLHFYTIREIKDDFNDDWDLAVIKERAFDSQLFIAERLTEQYISIPIQNKKRINEIFLQINGEKQILLFYANNDESNTLYRIEIGKIR